MLIWRRMCSRDMPLLSPSSRVAVVGGLTMGSRASKARKTTWKNIVDLGQMDGLG